MNFINCWIEEGDNDTSLNVYTTPCALPTLVKFKASSPQVVVRRYGLAVSQPSFVLRLVHYIIYYFRTLLHLAITRPDTILYYDTISSFPACVYKLFLNRSCRIFIHHHEYMTKEEYAGGMILLRWFHLLERKIYSSADWVSHTNEDRMNLFLRDMAGIDIKNRYTLPNYPPANWYSGRDTAIEFPIRFVQVGSLGINAMYVKEFAEWIVARNGQATWDIYTLVIDTETRAYLESLNSKYICLKKPVNYNELPGVLKNYDIGVILYKGHIPNYIYNAPNKMFEYYSCGLDVWFPEQMVTARRYATTDSYPKIISIEFGALPAYKIEVLAERKGVQYLVRPYTAQAALKELINKLRIKKAR